MKTQNRAKSLSKTGVNIASDDQETISESSFKAEYFRSAAEKKPGVLPVVNGRALVKEWRELIDISQEQLAEKFGLSPAVIRRIEMLGGKLRTETVEMLARQGFCPGNSALFP